MSDYNQLVREHARLALLRFLEGAPKYTSNVSMMTQLLHRVGISFTRDQTMTEIAWLYEQGLVETEERVGFVIATATVRGIEVAQGIATHPGVQRRRPGTYKNPAGARIADMVMPRQPVPAEKFKWTEYPLAEAFNTPDAQVGRTGRVKQLEFGGTEKTDSVDDYGLETPIPYSDIQAAATARANGLSKYDPERHSVNMLMETIENIREARVAGIVHNPDTYAAARRIALTGMDRFDDYANSDPIQVIKDAILGTLIYRPNTLVLGMEVWSFLSSHPKIVNAIKGNLTDEGIVTREQFVALFSGEGITQLLVATPGPTAPSPARTRF